MRIEHQRQLTVTRILPVTSCDLGAATGMDVSRLPCRTPCYVNVVPTDERIAARVFWTDTCSRKLECLGELTHAQLRSLVALAALTPEPLPPKEFF